MNRLDEIKAHALADSVPIMQDGGLAILCELVKNPKVKRVLEYGTAVGYSAIAMANANTTVEIDTFEIDQNRYSQAIDNIKALGLDNRIHAYLQDGKQAQLNHCYDVVFVDAAKAQYKLYMEHAKAYLSEYGVYVFDNLNFHGIVDNPQLTNNRNTRSLVKKIKVFRDWLLTDPSIDVIFYKTQGDGVAVVKYRKESK